MSVLPSKCISVPATVRPSFNSNLNIVQLAIGSNHLPGVFSERRVNCGDYAEEREETMEEKGKFGRDSGILAQEPWVNPINQLPATRRFQNSLLPGHGFGFTR